VAFNYARILKDLANVAYEVCHDDEDRLKMTSVQNVFLMILPLLVSAISVLSATMLLYCLRENALKVATVLVDQDKE